jgi:hypothetical protein
MSSTKRAGYVEPVTAEDHCLVHHFIRTHGRRPSASELQLLRRRMPVPQARAVPSWAPAMPVLGVLRRGVAKLVSRL